jgi:hypothetical protein
VVLGVFGDAGVAEGFEMPDVAGAHEGDGFALVFVAAPTRQHRLLQLDKSEERKKTFIYFASNNHFLCIFPYFSTSLIEGIRIFPILSICDRVQINFSCRRLAVMSDGNWRITQFTMLSLQR